MRTSKKAAKATKTVRTNKKATILGLPIEGQTIEEAVVADMTASRMESPTRREKAAAEAAVAEKKSRRRFAILHLDPILWEEVKGHAKATETSAMEVFAESVVKNLDAVLTDLQRAGIARHDRKRVRCSPDPEMWANLREASDTIGLPAVMLLQLCARRLVSAKK